MLWCEMEGETRNVAVPQGDEEVLSPFFLRLSNKFKVSYKARGFSVELLNSCSAFQSENMFNLCENFVVYFMMKIRVYSPAGHRHL